MINQQLLNNNILAAPDIDAHRLNYANWCEETNEPSLAILAKYIRATIALSHIPCDEKSIKQFDLTQEIQFLQEECLGFWRVHSPEYVIDIQLMKGFPEYIKIDVSDFLQFADDLYSMAPIRHLDLINIVDHIEPIFESKLLVPIRSVSMRHCQLQDEHMPLIANSENISALRWLSIAHNNITQQGAEYLASSPNFTEMVYIDFMGNPFEPNEQYSYDNGYVVDAGLPDDGERLEQRYGYIPWLHHDAKTIADASPERFIFSKNHPD